MPDVPQVPGVPALSSYGADDFTLAITDALSVVISLFSPSWGIFIDGSPVITPASIVTQAIGATLSAISNVAALIGLPNVIPCTASTISFEFSGDSPISNYPQEGGAFQSYNKVQLPGEIRLRLACGGGALQRQAFFGTLEALRTSTALVDILTPEKAFASYNCKHVDWKRDAGRGVDLVQADVFFEQVAVIAATSFSNTATPAAAGQQSTGNVQPQAPTDSVQQQFDTQSASQGLF